jgi:unsaturated chondroitin disaccharide hydrolase
MKSNKAILLLTLLMSTVGFSQPGQIKMQDLIKKNLALASEQYTILESNLPADRMPKSFSEAKQKLETSDTKWWCSGFYPGTLWYIYEYTKRCRHQKSCRSTVGHP